MLGDGILTKRDRLLAARCGGPTEGVYHVNVLQMKVNKPRNLGDGQLLDNAAHFDLPTSEATETSYFLQRIRLAEVSRNIADQNNGAANSIGSNPLHAVVTAMDAELKLMASEIPPFLDISHYNNDGGSERETDNFIFAYMLNSIVHTQRCKLHLIYLTGGLDRDDNDTAYNFSRATCLESARHIIRGEVQLRQSQHPFVLVQVRLTAILYGVFVANIVLLMDICVNRPESLEHELLNGDVRTALRMMEHAKSHSLAAAKLHACLMRIIAKHRANIWKAGLRDSKSQRRQSFGNTSNSPGALLNKNNLSHRVTRVSETPTPMSALCPPPPDDYCNSFHHGHGNALLNDCSAPSHTLYSAGDFLDAEGVNWDDLLSSVASSSFF